MGRGPAALAEWMAEKSGRISVDRLLWQKRGGVKKAERDQRRGRESEGRKVPPIIQEVPGRSPFSVLSAPNTSEMVVGGWEASGRGRLLSTTRAPTVID